MRKAPLAAIVEDQESRKSASLQLTTKKQLGETAIGEHLWNMTDGFATNTHYVRHHGFDKFSDWHFSIQPLNLEMRINQTYKSVQQQCVRPILLRIEKPCGTDCASSKDGVTSVTVVAMKLKRELSDQVIFNPDPDILQSAIKIIQSDYADSIHPATMRSALAVESVLNKMGHSVSIRKEAVELQPDRNVVCFNEEAPVHLWLYQDPEVVKTPDVCQICHELCNDVHSYDEMNDDVSMLHMKQITKRHGQKEAFSKIFEFATETAKLSRLIWFTGVNTENGGTTDLATTHGAAEDVDAETESSQDGSLSETGSQAPSSEACDSSQEGTASECTAESSESDSDNADLSPRPKRLKVSKEVDANGGLDAGGASVPAKEVISVLQGMCLPLILLTEKSPNGFKMAQDATAKALFAELYKMQSLHPRDGGLSVPISEWMSATHAEDPSPPDDERLLAVLPKVKHFFAGLASALSGPSPTSTKNTIGTQTTLCGNHLDDARKGILHIQNRVKELANNL